MLIPFLILGSLEIGLRVFGYQKDAQELFIEVESNPDYLVANTKFIERYFPAFVPQVAPNAFKKEKAPNTFRVFVFGGSSAVGFPYNFYYSFADQLEQKLLLRTEGVNIEVVNLGMTAVNSYVIHDLSKRVDDFEPDAIIIYAGHNEFYGSFGAASTQFSVVNNVGIKRLILWLKDWRLYQFLESLIPADTGEQGDRRTMMAKVVKHADIKQDSEIFNDGIQQFEANLGDVISSFTTKEIPVFIGTVASNLKDQDPLSDSQIALLAFEEGQSLFAAGDTTKALAKFIKAKELDEVRFRAPNAINEVIKGFADVAQVYIVDVKEVLRQNSESGIEDASLFIDHLHPNFNGHFIMADVFFEEITKIPLINRNLIDTIFERPNRISQFEETYSTVAIERLLAGYPFTKGISQEEELANFNAIYNQYEQRSYIDSLAAFTAKTQQVVPEKLTEVINYARVNNDSLAFISHYYELLKWQLNSISLIEKGTEYAINNRANDLYLLNMMLQVVNDGNTDPRYMDVISSLYLINNRPQNAKYWLERSEKMDPNSSRMLYNFARYHLVTGDSLTGQDYFRRFLETQQR
ncbi:MAG: SGNH/GDSL hydrolase family protein [Balneolaceae bacterium]|nr:SGNH/GDSL hydrolase family protein [Balneolaceae bacterium]